MHKNPLWSIEVRTVKKAIVSTNIICVGKNKEKLVDKLIDCPLCGDKLFKEEGKERTFLFRSKKTGQECFV